MTKKLTWLHLSDIHFCKNKSWRDEHSKNSLLDFIQQKINTEPKLMPDFIFCTGDIAFGEASQDRLTEQYESAKKFFDKLLTVCGGLSKDRLFVVPGNHDVNRKMINKHSQSALIEMASNSAANLENIQQSFNDRDLEFNDAIKRLDDYGCFVKEYLPHQYDVDGRHHYALVVDCNGLKVGVAGFNSAWSCSGPEDDRNIWLAAGWQFNSAYEKIKNAELKIGLIHHPVDWLNISDRDITTKRIGFDFNFWLHGHSHNAWVDAQSTHVVIAAGAVGALTSDEFGVNITTFNFEDCTGKVNLFSKKIEAASWTISPIASNAPLGVWDFGIINKSSMAVCDSPLAVNVLKYDFDLWERSLKARLDEALLSFSSQPVVWVKPIVKNISEVSSKNNNCITLDLNEFVKNPKSCFIKAPPQHGLTCLSHYLVLEAYKLPSRKFWLYLDATSLTQNYNVLDSIVMKELKLSSFNKNDVSCVVLDSWNANHKNSDKVFDLVIRYFKDLPVVCLQQDDGIGIGRVIDSSRGGFDVFYLWSLSRESIRLFVEAYNNEKFIGEDEDAITNRLVLDFDAFNLHRTPLNCLTLLKVFEVDFDENPVNRTEVIKMVLFLLFNVDDIPAYKTRPDWKDCEFVLGHFCEKLMRSDNYNFTREYFIADTSRFCIDNLLDIDTDVVFDVLYRNNIIVCRGKEFCFRFSYWIFYFLAQRMHHSPSFAQFMFAENRYACFPEIIEFYTGIDRKREDAIKVLIADINDGVAAVNAKCGFPSGFNPYKFAKWMSTPEIEEKMERVVLDGVSESNLPDEIKSQYADRTYDSSKPYNQVISSYLMGNSFDGFLKTLRAGSRALRNSDYVSTDMKRELLRSILGAWEEVTKVLFVVLPALVEEGKAEFDGTDFVLMDDFFSGSGNRFVQVLSQIPYNVVNWSKEDLLSQKMGPLLFDTLSAGVISEIVRHELILLLIMQRPRGWSEAVDKYMKSLSFNSFYLLDVSMSLREQYRFAYASNSTLKEIESLWKKTYVKHLSKDGAVKGRNLLNIEKSVNSHLPKRELS